MTSAVPPDFEFKRHTDTPCMDHDRRIALMEQALFGLKTASEGIVIKLDLLLAQTTKVAVLEERHLVQTEDLNRAYAKLTALEKTLGDHMKEASAFMNHTRGRDKVLWAIGAAVLALLIKALFFAAHLVGA